MSQENVERLRAFLEPWGREPWTPEAWERGEVIDMSFLDPDIVYEDENLPDHVGEAYRGHEGIRRAARRWVEPNEWLLVELKQIIGQGDRFVSVHRVQSKARYSGIEFDARVRLDLPRRKDRPLPIIPGSRRRPRSRRTAEVARRSSLSDEEHYARLPTHHLLARFRSVEELRLASARASTVTESVWRRRTAGGIEHPRKR